MPAETLTQRRRVGQARRQDAEAAGREASPLRQLTQREDGQRAGGFFGIVIELDVTALWQQWQVSWHCASMLADM